MLFLVLVTSTKHYWVISAERRRVEQILIHVSYEMNEALLLGAI